MRKPTALLLFALFILPVVLFAAERSFKITTYYPAPFGEYKQVKTEKLKVEEGNKTVGNVLISDGSGNAKWDVPPGGTGLLTYKGATATSYHGNLGNDKNNGYGRADEICQAEVTGSKRVCSAADFVNGLPTDSGWYNIFVTYYSVRGADCGGWTSNCNDDHGAVWDATQKRASAAVCGNVPSGSNQPRKILCCG